jgi:alpha-L-rhamnosidase
VESDPGYRSVKVAPRPAAGFRFAGASIETPFGQLSIDWEVSVHGDFIAQLTVPFGATAILDLPSTQSSKILANGEPVTNGTSLSYGSYILSVSNPAIVSFR